MSDHSQAFNLVEVFLDLWVQGSGAFSGGMYHGMEIMLELDLVFARESTNAHESIQEFLSQVISGPDGLGCCGDCSRLDLCCCGGLGGFVPGLMSVMAQFIFMIANLSHEGRPRMTGPGVSAMYQYELILWGQTPGPSGCQTMGPWSAPCRGIWDPL